MEDKLINQLQAIKTLKMLGYTDIDTSILFKKNNENLCVFDIEFIEYNNEYRLVKTYPEEVITHFKTEIELYDFLKKWESENRDYKFTAIESFWLMNDKYNPLRFVDYGLCTSRISYILHDIFYTIRFLRKPVSINNFIKTYKRF